MKKGSVYEHQTTNGAKKINAIIKKHIEIIWTKKFTNLLLLSNTRIFIPIPNAKTPFKNIKNAIKHPNS